MIQVRNTQESAIRYVRGSMMAFLEGKKNLPWLTGVITKGGGISIATAMHEFAKLRNYGDPERLRELLAWFDSQQ